jgi:hypothetical protein
MNHRERRRMSKKLGIRQYQQKLPRNKKFELLRENIIAGNKLERENAEAVRVDIQAQMEQIESQSVFSIAEVIAKRKGIAVLDAMEEAQKEINKGRK